MWIIDGKPWGEKVRGPNIQQWMVHSATTQHTMLAFQDEDAMELWSSEEGTGMRIGWVRETGRACHHRREVRRKATGELELGVGDAQRTMRGKEACRADRALEGRRAAIVAWHANHSGPQ